MRATARVLAISSGSKRSLKNVTIPVEVRSLQNAERLWIQGAQRFLQQNFQEGKFRRLCARKNEERIIVVGGRAIRAFESSYDAEELILLPYNHPMSRLYAQRVHKRGHTGASTTMSKIRSRFWIPNLRQKCRATERRLESQTMGSLPKERLSPAPAWTATAIDFFGPFITRGETNKRSYSLVFNCLASRAVYAVYVDVGTDYSTERVSDGHAKICLYVVSRESSF